MRYVVLDKETSKFIAEVDEHGNIQGGPYPELTEAFKKRFQQRDFLMLNAPESPALTVGVGTESPQHLRAKMMRVLRQFYQIYEVK